MVGLKIFQTISGIEQYYSVFRAFVVGSNYIPTFAYYVSKKSTYFGH